MNLAAILGIYLLSLGFLSRTGGAPAVILANSSMQQTQSSEAASPQNSDPAQPSPPPSSQTPDSAVQAKPSKTGRQHKRTVPPDCTNSPAPLDPAAGNPTDVTNPAGTPQKNADAAAMAPALKPCPPPKKVVRNGGSSEPAIQITGGTTAEQAVHQRSTAQLTAATEENLKQVEGRDLTSNQQELKNQIKQFMAQSKTAVAAGDLERGHDLALKAHLLSDELLKP
jgi:hypothetical protein